jgi:hypothetical protein
VKAVRQKSTTDEVVKRKIVTEKVAEDSDNSDQTKGQDEVLEVSDSVAACCHQAQKVNRKIISENRALEDETTSEDPDDVPEQDASNDIVGELMALIEKYSLEDVKKAIAEVESYM